MKIKMHFPVAILFMLPLLAVSGDYFSDNLFEADKVGFVWIIRKYVDKDARFYFLEKGQVKENAIAFDIPSAKYRRFPKYGTTSCAVKIHKIEDGKALKLAALIDEIELDFWGAQKSQKAKKIESDLKMIFEKEKNADTITEKSFRYLDAVADSL